MYREKVTQQSTHLERPMNVLVYGTSGYPVIVFPTQDATCTNYEDFGMVETLADYLEAGSIQLFCVDSVDKESWSDSDLPKERRAATQEAYYNYVCDEVVPFVHERNGSTYRPLLTGCSMGATHSVIYVLRRPDLFQGCIALSGVYSADCFFGGWMNDTLYLNSPTHFLPNMPADHPYVKRYNHRQIVLCVGRGAWEEDGIWTQQAVEESFRRLGVGAWCDYWGYDVNHDWPWWKKQIRYFLPITLRNIERRVAGEAAEGGSRS